MKNKYILTLALFLSMGRFGIFAQTAGVTGGTQWLWLYDGSYNNPVTWTYSVGYQQSILSKICLGVVFNTSLNADLIGHNEIEVKAEPGVYIRFQNAISKYKSLSFESRYFLNDFDEVPVGVYIASSYKYGFFNSTNTILVISDEPGMNNGSAYPFYKQIASGLSYESACSIHSFGLKLGLMAGPMFNFYMGYDYNMPFITEHQNITNSNLKLSPPVIFSSFNLGLSLGFGLGY
ncbi:MAG: hypothetical protein Q8M15_11615 [Bacteroidota bacterium]|nr:hypothetical protein [Bacteroidota bacterium]